MYSCEYGTHECVNDTLECALYTQSAIPYAECDFHTQCDFYTPDCDYGIHNCDFNTFKSEFYTQSVILIRMNMILKLMIGLRHARV
jgi:hypothetical protein